MRGMLGEADLLEIAHSAVNEWEEARGGKQNKRVKKGLITG